MPFKPLESNMGTLPTVGGFKPLSNSQVATEPVQGISDKIWSAISGYGSRLGESYKQGAQNIISSFRNVPEQIRAGEPLSVVTTRPLLRTAGQISRSAFAPITEAVAPVVGPAIKSVVESSPMLQQIIQKASELASKYPETAKDIQDFVDIATLGVGSAVEKPLAAEAKAVGKDIVSGIKIALTPSEKAIESKVTTLFQKSIKPTAKKTLTQAEKYDNNVIQALKTIKDNAPNLNIEDTAGEIISGRTPQTINELAQAVDQTKRSVFTQYDTLAKQANKVGASVNAETIANEVAQVASNKALQITNPEVVAYAESWARRLKEFEEIDSETAQAVIQNLNNGLQAFYKNPTYEAASKVAIDAGIANNFRKLLDDAIENATGKEYQVLKNQYAALKAIETDVTRAAMRDARKNVKGLLDYSDIFTGGQMISGIFSLNPSMFTKGAIERGLKEFYKYLNDPNRAIKNIFDELDVTTGQTFEPQSAIGKFLQNPKAGASIEDVSKSIPKELIAEAKKYKTAEEFVGVQSKIRIGDKVIYRGDRVTIEKITPDGKAAMVRYYPSSGLVPVNTKELIPNPKTAYHGSKADFETFDISKQGLTTNAPSAKEGFFFTTKKNIAEGYANLGEIQDIDLLQRKQVELEKIAQKTNKKSDWDKVDTITQKIDELAYSEENKNRIGFIKEVVLDYKNPLVKDMGGKAFQEGESTRIIKQAKDDGYDAVIFKNVADSVDTPINAKGIRPSNERADTIVVFRPEQIKTKSQLTDIWNQANK